MKFLIILILNTVIISSTFAQATQKLTLKDLSILSARVPDDQFDGDLAKARTRKLHAHKAMGHATMGLMAVAGVTAAMGLRSMDQSRNHHGGRKNASDANKMHLHIMVASAALATYYATAYMGLSAPRPMSMEDEKKRLWHKRLAWIHGPAMLLAPVLGYLAYSDYKQGQDPSGLAKLHRPIMWTGITALAGAWGLMTFEF